MTLFQFLGAFRAYNADVLIIALGVTLLVSLAKKTVLKNVPKKLLVFAPFLLGTLLYACWRAIATGSAIPFTSDIAHTIEGGFACGCAATLYYVIYEQFFRMKKDVSVLTPLLQPYLADEALQEAENKLLEGYVGLTEEERLPFVRETLLCYLPELEEEELCALASLVNGYLAKLNV